MKKDYHINIFYSVEDEGYIAVEVLTAFAFTITFFSFAMPLNIEGQFYIFFGGITILLRWRGGRQKVKQGDRGVARING